MLKKVFFVFFVALIFAGVTPMLSGYWVFKSLKDQPDIKVKGDFRLRFMSTSFTVRKAFIRWDEKVEANADNLEVRYSLYKLFRHGRIHVRLTADEVSAELKSEWKSLAPVSKQFFKNVLAEISFKEGKLDEIYQINAESKDVHLKFGLSNHVKDH